MTDSKPTSKSARIRTLLEGGAAPADIAKQVGCSLPLVYQVRTKMRGGSSGKSTGSARSKKRAPASSSRRGDVTDQLSQLSDIAAAVKNVEADRARLRATLEKIQGMIADALA